MPCRVDVPLLSMRKRLGWGEKGAVQSQSGNVITTKAIALGDHVEVARVEGHSAPIGGAYSDGPERSHSGFVDTLGLR